MPLLCLRLGNGCQPHHHHPCRDIPNRASPKPPHSQSNGAQPRAHSFSLLLSSPTPAWRLRSRRRGCHHYPLLRVAAAATQYWLTGEVTAARCTFIYTSLSCSRSWLTLAPACLCGGGFSRPRARLLPVLAAPRLRRRCSGPRRPVLAPGASSPRACPSRPRLQAALAA